MARKHLLIPVLLLCSVLYASLSGAQIVSTVVGSGTMGYGGEDSLATDVAVKMNCPRQITTDTSGNFYFADKNNFVVRKISAATGRISLFAGNNTTGYSGDTGPATAAQLLAPVGVATDKLGNVYIADLGTGWDPVAGKAYIRKVDAMGTITTIAGTGTGGFSGDGGPATAAQIRTPMGMALDKAGNLYFADSANQTIRKIDPSGNISTVVGKIPFVAGFSGDGGPATAARLNYPVAIAFDTAENMFILDSHNNAVRKVNKAGIITTIAGNPNFWWLGTGYTGDGGPATNAQFNYPIDIATDTFGCLYVADVANDAVRMILPNGKIITIAGNYTKGYNGDGLKATDTKLNGPNGITIYKNHLYVSDSGNSRIRKLFPHELGVNDAVVAPRVVKIAPNPGSGSFLLVGQMNSEDDEIMMKIEDVAGRTVMQQKIAATNGAFKEHVTLNSDLPAGLYLVHLVSGTENQVIKFIKER